MPQRSCLALGALGFLLAGCATTQSTPLPTDPHCHPKMEVAGQRTDLASALLFDRRPGPFYASDFAYRSDWPSTVSYYSPSQIIYFRERFVDYQGRGFGGSDSTYRRAETQRFGVGYR